LGFETEEDIDNIGAFKQQVITLLTSLIEGEVDIEIVNLMVNALDFEIMKNRMLNVFKRFAETILDRQNLVVREIPFKKIFDKLQKDSFDTSVAEAFEIYILLHSLQILIVTLKECFLKSILILISGKRWILLGLILGE